MSNKYQAWYELGVNYAYCRTNLTHFDDGGVIIEYQHSSDHMKLC